MTGKKEEKGLGEEEGEGRERGGEGLGGFYQGLLMQGRFIGEGMEESGMSFDLSCGVSSLSSSSFSSSISAFSQNIYGLYSDVLVVRGVYDPKKRKMAGNWTMPGYFFIVIVIFILLVTIFSFFLSLFIFFET